MPREKKFTEATKTVSFRCPENRLKEFRASVNDILDGYTEKIAAHYGIPKEEIVQQGARYENTERIKLGDFTIQIPCGCAIVGSTPSGAPIWKRCKEHKKQ